MTRKKSEDAVSPVIGVMLMLVVVIVVGAVVTVFATGLVGDTEVAPVAKLKVEIISEQPIEGTPGGEDDTWNTGTVPTLHLTHISGDPVDTADLKLSFAWDCEVHGHHTSTYQYSEKFGSGYGTGSGVQGAFGLDCPTEIFVPTNYGAYIQPLYINYGQGAENNYGVSVMDGAYFGDHVLKRGEIMMAYDLHLIVPRDGTKHAGNPAMDALFNNGIVKSHMQEGELIAPKCPTCGGDVSTDDLTCYGDNDDGCYFSIAEDKGEEYRNAHPEEYSIMCPCGAVFEDTDPSGTKFIYNTFLEGKCSECKQAYAMYEGGGYSAGIMACLPEGTPVNVMITHIPSGQVIYEQKVFVE